MSRIGNGSMPLRIGNIINATIYGGPYLKRPDGFYGVKMAEEIDAPYEAAVPTKDFSTPDPADVRTAVIRTLMAAMSNREVYVGCYGGIGRTGLFMAILAKVQIDFRKLKHRSGRGDDPLVYLREHYLSYAVETQEQEQYLADFDTSEIVAWLDSTQTILGLGGVTPPSENFVPAEEEIDPGVEGVDYQTYDWNRSTPPRINLLTRKPWYERIADWLNEFV